MVASDQHLLEAIPLKQKHHVLCVDDDPAVLAALKRCLRDEPYEVVAAQTAEQALEILEKGPISLLLTDQRMPGMCGADLFEKARRRSPRTQRVMLTAYPGSTRVGYGLACEEIDWLISKPWNDETLKLTLRQLLQGLEAADAPAEGKPASLHRTGDSAAKIPPPSRDPRKAAAPPATIAPGKTLRRRARIEARLGCYPAFFMPAEGAPGVVDWLWRQTVAAYLDNPLPPLFKEKLSAYLARFCASPYPLHIHSCGLRALGMAGPDVLSLLEEPPPALEPDLADSLARLAAVPAPLESWPVGDPGLDRALLRCSVPLFRGGIDRCRIEMSRVLGPSLYLHLGSLLSHLRTCHAWAEIHALPAPMDDPRVREWRPLLLKEEPRLEGFFLTHVERGRRERRKVEDKLLDLVSVLRRRESALRRDLDKLESKIRERTSELTRINEGLAQEVLEHREAEEEARRVGDLLVQGQKLQAIGQLAAGLAHEINNPVGFILSNLATLSGYAGDLSRLLRAAFEFEERAASGKDFLREVEEFGRIRKAINAEFIAGDLETALAQSREGAERIRDLARRLEEFARAEPEEQKPVALTQCLEDAIRLSWSKIKHKAQVQREYSEVPPVLGTASRLEQVFMNLLVNAAQAIETRGEIHVSLKREEAEAVVRVQDTGKGIAPDRLKRLFEPFFATRLSGQGTGIGLQVAQRIVRAHQGRIEVTSEVGRGTEVSVRLPLAGLGGAAC
jgi:signal transduction histidine kinase/CheY-like chemotaxis protein